MRRFLTALLLALLGLAAARAECPCGPDGGAGWDTLRNGDRLLRIDFALGHPGARSLGMGGAFGGIADDSTAALTNPAALTQLLRPELAFEMRQASAGGDTVGSATVELAPGAILTNVGPRQPWSRRQAPAGPTYLAASYAGKRWVVATFRHRLAELHDDGIALEIEGQGLAAGWRLTPAIAIGANWIRYRGDVRLDDQIFGGNPATLAIASTTRIDDAVDAFAGGIFVRPGPRWTVGAYYRQGGALQVEQEVRVVGIERESRFAGDPLELPSSWGLGIGFRPTESLLLDLDASRATHTRHQGAATESHDVDVLALGAEYAFWSLSWAPALRLGVSTELDPLPAPPGIPATPDHRWQVSAGAGVVFVSHWQLDLAIRNLGRSEPEISLATVLRF